MSLPFWKKTTARPKERGGMGFCLVGSLGRAQCPGEERVGRGEGGLAWGGAGGNGEEESSACWNLNPLRTGLLSSFSPTSYPVQKWRYLCHYSLFFSLEWHRNSVIIPKGNLTFYSFVVFCAAGILAFFKEVSFSNSQLLVTWQPSTCDLSASDLSL